MGIGFMANWRCAFTVQSPGPAGPSARPQQQPQQHPAPPVKGKDTCFETARVSILHTMPEEGELLHTHVLRTFTSSLEEPQRNQSNSVKMEEVNADKKHEGSKKFGIMKNVLMEDTTPSDNLLRFSLLMENLNEIEGILDDSDLVKLEREILIQVERLGALNLFDACLSRTYMIPVSLNLAFSLTEPKEYSLDFPVNEEVNNGPVDEQMSNIVVPSRRKKERKLRRQRVSEKAANMPALSLSSKIIHKDRNDTVAFASNLTGTYSKSRTRRLALARNESRMSMGVKDVAKLEKARLELEEKTGEMASFLRWAQAVGTDEKTLQQRLYFGWYCKDRLLKSTRSLVIYIARSYRGMGIAFDDLIQVHFVTHFLNVVCDSQNSSVDSSIYALQAGNVGVLQGAERFDSNRGYKFSTYVQYWIRKSMSAVIARHSRGIYIPATMEKAIKQLKKARSALSSSERRCLQDVDVAEFTGLSVAKVRLAGKCARVIGSIDQKIGDGLNIKGTEVTPDVSIRTPEETVMRQHMRKDIDKVLESLHPRERRVLLLRYGLEDGRRMSLEEIGRILHVSKEWVRRIEMAALAKLRKEEIQGQLKHYLHLQFT